jgi:hypothetical protein
LGRQRDLSGAMELQHQAAADHVAGLAVGLDPTPRRTDFEGETVATQVGMLGNQLAQKDHVGWADLAAAIVQDHVGHAPQFKEGALER